MKPDPGLKLRHKLSRQAQASSNKQQAPKAQAVKTQAAKNNLV